MSSPKGKDNPAASVPSKESEGLLTSEDIFGDMLDAADKAAPAKPRPAAPAAPEAARKGPIKVKVSEPRTPERSPFEQGADAPSAGEALPEDVAALLDAFSEPGEAATRANASPPIDTHVEPPAAAEPVAAKPEAAEPGGDSLLDAIIAPDDSLSLLQDLENLGAPPAQKAAPAETADPAWSYDVPVPASRMGTRFKAAAPRSAGADSGALDLGALADAAFAEAAPLRPAPRAPAPAPPRATPPPAAPSPAEPAAQETYGPYQLLEKIAVGGMAELFRAKRTGVEGFEKVVAVKRILPHLSDNKEFVDMFIDEAKMVAGLAHPNIVQISDLGKIEKSYYIAMEYVHGRDLRSILRRAKERGTALPPDLAVLIASRVCSALEYAHRKKDDRGQKMKIVHRDVSPQNILISFEGDVKLTDFGIAKAATKATAHESGALRGKLLYMSPEQAWGKPMDRRSDIFSLGLVLYEMLTDQRPFLGNSELSILEMVRQCQIAPPSSVNPAIPEELERATMKALARDPEQRYDDAAEMQKDLERHLHTGRPPTGADIARFVQLLFEQEERGEPVSDEPTSGVHRQPGADEPPAEAPAAEAATPEAAGQASPAKEASSIQKFLRRFGIK
jgi:serine/threonine protein kinase